MEAYLVTNRRLVAESYFPRFMQRAVVAGVDRIQVREKDLGGRELFRMARNVMVLTRSTRTTVFVNDRVDVAMAVSAAGVHLGGTAIPMPKVRRIGGDDLVIGASAHSLKEARDAEEGGADYLFFGPIFETPSKAAFGPPVGIPELKIVLGRVRIPVYAIGGIGPDNLDQLHSLPLAGVAMVSAFVRAPSMQDLVREVHRKRWV